MAIIILHDMGLVTIKNLFFKSYLVYQMSFQNLLAIEAVLDSVASISALQMSISQISAVTVRYACRSMLLGWDIQVQSIEN
ncbi:hypothetical protein BpHYR1_031700 [Brachionus plicatilis]|uniref:Uncharacterized protein n=1 Tax=Brachionus plicatilis TaxID=10195 RepID=A0A3M7QNV1_BRAPC|nr:hypothetical protein BpHYR1_031700 [Brachionus plicatilis]